MKFKSIIFTATYSYLSIPLYKAITPHLQDYNNILLLTNDPTSTSFDSKYIDNEDISAYFDKYHKLIGDSYDHKRKWEKIWLYKQYQKQIYSFFNELKPNAVVSTSDMSLSDRIISAWCKKNNIPFFIIQPALIAGKDRFGKKSRLKHGLRYKILRLVLNTVLRMPLLQKQHLFGNEDDVNYLLLWSKYSALNPNKKNTFFVGNPAFDYIFKEFDNSQTRILRNNVLICTQNVDLYYSEWKFSQLMKMYIKAVKEKKDLTFYIKVHPREPVEKYERIFNVHEFSNIRIVKYTDLFELLKICDVQISFASTTALEAIAIGVPIIIPNPDNLFELVDHFRGEIEIRAIKIDKIGNCIDKARSNDYRKIFLKKREEYCKKLLYSTDGRSGERAAIKIKEIIC